MSGVRRIILWLSGTVATLALLFGYHTSLGGSTPTETAAAYSGTLAGSSSTPTDTTTDTTTATKGAGSGGSSGSSAKSATKTTTGTPTYTRYGPVQVQITTSGSTITKVSVLQYPNSDSRDAQINGYALPVLVQETLDKQGAGIDMVSGATYTSDGYRQSLQSALDRAGL
ncbi:FMN-binding protein [Nocardioides phosphati]|uniref:FMN-binding protein n=1 Tax=Nocardioides phosphati TaxID=1867775 RepID=A0ABQ2N9Q6_9ACTN|nr:FMN-binding protein [Nocardioides phosphati]GGO89699.1 FMN-binding protein [Nocardioides phosphati]